MSIYRRKAAMVMYAIEQELGEYACLKCVPEQLTSTKIAMDIRSREYQKGLVVSTPKEIVSASYLGEVLDLCLGISTNTSDYDAFKEIKQLFDKFAVFDIRNSIAHPNKNFPESYWYKIAAVGCDPLFDKVGITDIKSQVKMAEEGSIANPPDEWLKMRVFFVQNNIPQIFEHEVTGLVGRVSEKKALLKAINNPRQGLYALVAPGGTGKTALALDVLSEICSNPAYIDKFDAVFFVSLKTEELTANGVIKVSSAKSIDDLKYEVVEQCNAVFNDVDVVDFKDSVDKCGNRKILVCVDNLETLLIEGADFLEIFVNELPASWKVLVTSRIPVQSAYSIPLEQLDDDSAKQLARIYNARQGNSKISVTEVERIAISCFRNPLSIRLALDAIFLGKPISDAISTSKSSVLDYSFSNLMDVLDNNQTIVLETIFVIGEPTRFDIAEAADLAHEAVSHALNTLCRTSLVVRGGNDGEDEERYKINDSLRELLFYRVSHLPIRNDISARIINKRNHAREILHVQKERGVTRFSPYYIPSTLSESLQVELYRVVGIIKNKKQALYADAYRKLAGIEQIYSRDPYYWRSFAMLSSELGDNEGCVSKYNKSIECDTGDPVNKFLLARYYFDVMKDYAHSEIIYRELRDSGWWDVAKSDEYFSRGVCSGYFLSMLYQNKYQQVLDETKEWKISGAHRGILGTFRASAYKRSVEAVITIDLIGSAAILTKAIRVLGDVFRNDGYPKMAASEAKKVIDELVYILERNLMSDQTVVSEWLTFICEHLEEILVKSIKGKNSLPEYIRRLQSSDNSTVSIEFGGNKWQSILNGGDIQTPQTSVINLTKVEVTSIPQDKDFLFAVDSAGNEYFIHAKRILNVDSDSLSFRRLKIGDNFSVKRSETTVPGKRIFVEKAWLIADH